MHILFVHQNFPAQFGHVADMAARRAGFRCTYVSELPGRRFGSIELIQHRKRGGATRQGHYCSRSFENATWQAHAVYEALKARPDVRPDLVVGHSGFGSTLFLRDLYDCPVVNYFEFFYHTRDSDMDFRPDFPPTEMDRLRARARNATILLDLENCDLGYSPTRWQRDQLPAAYRDKVRVVFDGVDTRIWSPTPGSPRRIGDVEIPAGKKVITYATRGMESIRGFDIFMRVAKRLCDRRDDVMFLVAGEDRVCYGKDPAACGGKSFKEWTLAQDDYDMSRFAFLGKLPPSRLARLFNLSDLHLYLTVPFVLSWSLMDALACGATVLASDTAPVREMITHGENGLLADFFDVEGWVETANRVLDHPGDFATLGRAGEQMIRDRYSLDACFPQMLDLYEGAATARRLAS